MTRGSAVERPCASRVLAWLLAASLAGCAVPHQTGPVPAAAPRPATTTHGYRGTAEPFAANSVYFVVTDRFVNGDPSNDQRQQGGTHPTFDLPVPGAPPGQSANVGYLGGDFRGVLDNAGYIRDMGFGAVWITPIVDNPDQHFTGGDAVKWKGFWTDRGKSGYHGYWGVNFYKLDEHLPSEGLDFAGFAAGMHDKGLKVVLDIVANHGSPAWTMPVAQPMFGQVFDHDGKLIADHQNLSPDKLDPDGNPLHAFFNTKGNLAQLSDFNENNPAVLEYLAEAYLQWIGQGADAFRIDTIGWMPDSFWRKFTARIRARHPGFFMFAEAFDYEAAKIAGHTQSQNGSVSVLDFPLKQALDEVFGSGQAGFERLREPLFLVDGPYANPYELMTFYDNHDMPRMDATDAGFVDAHNWLFTARGIPVIYYGSEVGFMRGAAEHAGNRNYFGQQRIDAAPKHAIHAALRGIARIRRTSPALQRGLQLNIELQGDRAAFYRVVDDSDSQQVALVLLNKADTPTTFEVVDKLEPGEWRAAVGGRRLKIASGDALSDQIPAHAVEVWLRDGPVTRADMIAALDAAMEGRGHRAAPVPSADDAGAAHDQ